MQKRHDQNLSIRFLKKRDEPPRCIEGYYSAVAAPIRVSAKYLGRIAQIGEEKA